MCLESRDLARRRRLPALPALCFQDSDSEPTQLPLMQPRNSRPEIFTFDVESVQPESHKPLRRGHSGAKVKRPRKVLYPSKVRRYLPPPETDRPLRWFYLLCLLVFVQICCEEVPAEEPLQPTPAPNPAPLLQLSAEPALPCSNHSLQPLNVSVTLSWEYPQR